MEKPTPDDVGEARRQLENQIRIDCSRLLQMGADPEDIYQALLATSEFWFGELQDEGTNDIMETYTFKAECLPDVTNLLKNLTQKYEVDRVSMFFQEHCGDVQVVLTTGAKTNQVKTVMRQQPGSHVMVRTLEKAY